MAMAVLAAWLGVGEAAEVRLAWDPPTHSVDGQLLDDLAGYKIYYGTNSRLYSLCVNVGLTNLHTLAGLNGTSTYFIAITAYNSEGLESGAAGEMMWSGLDTDGNGMADLWEQAHLAGAPAEARFAWADADGDGIKNIDEFVAGLNPTNADSLLDLRVATASGQCQVQFDARRAAGTGYNGKTRYYALERCTNLAAGTWSVVPGYGAILATNQVVTFAAGTTPAATVCRTRVWLQ